MLLDFASVPIITLIVYWCIELIKQLTNNNENFKRFIPISSTVIGIILGVIIYFFIPSLTIANNVLYAIGVGGVSGLAATGSNQIFKQLGKFKKDKPNSTENGNNKEKNNENKNNEDKNKNNANGKDENNKDEYNKNKNK